MVCRFLPCGYLFFGLRISLVVKFPLTFSYGNTFAEFNCLSREICKSCPGTCRAYSAWVAPYSISICDTRSAYWGYWKFPLGKSSGLRPTRVGQPPLEDSWFLPPCSPLHCCVRLLHPSLCAGTSLLKLYENLPWALSCLSWELFRQFKCDYGINGKMI